MPPHTRHHQAEVDQIKKESDGRIVFKPRGLTIVWGADERYWRLPKENDVESPAELLQVSWLEVRGSAKVPAGKYSVHFCVSMKPDAFGWKQVKVRVMAKVGKKGRYMSMDADLEKDGEVPQDKALQIEVKNEDDLHFGLYEVWSGKWKGGLQIYEAVITPVPSNE